MACVCRDIGTGLVKHGKTRFGEFLQMFSKDPNRHSVNIRRSCYGKTKIMDERTPGLARGRGVMASHDSWTQRLQRCIELETLSCSFLGVASIHNACISGCPVQIDLLPPKQQNISRHHNDIYHQLSSYIIHKYVYFVETRNVYHHPPLKGWYTHCRNPYHGITRPCFDHSTCSVVSSTTYSFIQQCLFFLKPMIQCHTKISKIYIPRRCGLTCRTLPQMNNSASFLRILNMEFMMGCVPWSALMNFKQWQKRVKSTFFSILWFSHFLPGHILSGYLT
jgi:hypothetical protein